MVQIDRNKVKIRNLLGIIDEPTYEDLLYEIVEFLESEQRDTFKKKDVSQKTKCRVGEEVVDDLEALVEQGYLENDKKVSYRVATHPWEPEQQ